MDRRDTIKNKIISEGLLPLFYHADPNVCIAVATALYQAGVRIIEFTNRGEHAIANFKHLIAQRNQSMPGLLLAIGTIKSTEDAEAFIEAGADLLISPTFDAGVCDTAYINKILWIPGCMTPTEIQVAENAGCSLIKLFPGNVLGPSFVSAIKPLFPNLHFVVTGGVDTSPQNIEGWLMAGAAGVGLGSKLISNEVLHGKKYHALTACTTEVINHIKTFKSKSQ